MLYKTYICQIDNYNVKFVYQPVNQYSGSMDDFSVAAFDYPLF